LLLFRFQFLLQASEEEAKKLKEQVEMTLNKLEESKNLLKTNENGKWLL